MMVSSRKETSDATHADGLLAVAEATSDAVFGSVVPEVLPCVALTAPVPEAPAEVAAFTAP